MLNTTINFKGSAFSQKTKTLSFTGYQDFLNGMSSNIPKTTEEMQAQIAVQIPDLFKRMTLDDARQIYDLIDQGNKSTGVSGFTNFLLNFAKTVDPSKRVALINSLQDAISSVKASAPLGELQTFQGDDGKWKVKIISYDNNEGRASEITLNLEDHKNIIMGPNQRVSEFKQAVLGKEPKIIIGPVGWTVPDTEVLYDNNPAYKGIVDKFTSEITTILEHKRGNKVDSNDVELNDLVKRGKKQIADEFYQAAFEKFWNPIDKALFGTSETSSQRSKLGFVTSSSYAGIDKAAMQYAKNYNLTVANITPFAYAEWSDSGKEAPFPILVTNTIDDYAKAYNEFADILLVTGGRDHTFSKDFRHSMVDNIANTVIPVDIMKEVFAFEIPAVYQGKVANAAALLISKGQDVRQLDISKNLVPLPGLTETQNRVVTAIRTKLDQMTTVDPNAVANSLSKRIKT